MILSVTNSQLVYQSALAAHSSLAVLSVETSVAATSTIRFPASRDISGSLLFQMSGFNLFSCNKLFLTIRKVATKLFLHKHETKRAVCACVGIEHEPPPS
jgi:hypothetical protein